MADLLEKALSPAVLNHAWKFLRTDRGLWVQGLPVASMREDRIRYIGELAEEMKHGRYQPETMRCFEIDKADGGKRLISASSVRDKLAQRAVLTVLEPLGESVFLDESFGFRPSCTLDMALARVRENVRRGWVWLGDADVRTCFDAIPHRPLLKALYQHCRDRRIVAVIRQWIESMPEQHRPCGRGRGLPQGMVLSPFLCNLYLHALDRTLAGRGIPFVRFADDLITHGRSEREADKSLRIVGRKLRRLGLELHPDKTRVIRSSGRHRFLGKKLPDSRPRFQP